MLLFLYVAVTVAMLSLTQKVLGWALGEVRETLRLEHTDLAVMAAVEPELVATESMAAMKSDSGNCGDGIDALGRMSDVKV